MKRFFVKATLIVVLAFVAGSANAQEVICVNGMNIRTDEWSEASIKEHLTQNSADTLRI